MHVIDFNTQVLPVMFAFLMLGFTVYSVSIIIERINNHWKSFKAWRRYRRITA